MRHRDRLIGYRGRAARHDFAQRPQLRRGIRWLTSWHSVFGVIGAITVRHPFSRLRCSARHSLLPSRAFLSIALSSSVSGLPLRQTPRRSLQPMWRLVASRGFRAPWRVRSPSSTRRASTRVWLTVLSSQFGCSAARRSFRSWASPRRDHRVLGEPRHGCAGVRREKNAARSIVQSMIVAGACRCMVSPVRPRIA